MKKIITKIIILLAFVSLLAVNLYAEDVKPGEAIINSVKDTWTNQDDTSGIKVPDSTIKILNIFKKLHIAFAGTSYLSFLTAEGFGFVSMISLFTDPNHTVNPQMYEVLRYGHIIPGFIGLGLFVPQAVFSWMRFFIKRKYGLPINKKHVLLGIFTTTGVILNTISIIITGTAWKQNNPNLRYIAMAHCGITTNLFVAPFTIALFTGFF